MHACWLAQPGFTNRGGMQPCMHACTGTLRRNHPGMHAVVGFTARGGRFHDDFVMVGETYHRVRLYIAAPSPAASSSQPAGASRLLNSDILLKYN